MRPSHQRSIALAESFGARTYRVTETNSLEIVLTEAVQQTGVKLIECEIDYSMNELLSTDLLHRAQEAMSRK